VLGGETEDTTMAEDRHNVNVWKATSVGLVAAAIVAVITGIVVANRSGVSTDSKVVAPSASSAATEPRVAQAPSAPPAVSQPPADTAPARPASKGTPPQSVVDECNRVASQIRGPQQESRDKWGNIIKGGGVGALGGAAAGAAAGAIADGGKGAGKGALIGTGVGAGAGTLYGIYKNKQHDEGYRSAYIGCMRSKGYSV
jgi:hypothetical protein